MVYGLQIPKASEIHFLSPDIGIKAFAPILVEHKFVGVIDDSAETVVDKVPSNGKTQSKSDQRDNSDPFPSRVLTFLPRMINFFLLHPSRAEVSLVLLLMMEMNGR